MLDPVTADVDLVTCYPFTIGRPAGYIIQAVLIDEAERQCGQAEDGLANHPPVWRGCKKREQ